MAITGFMIWGSRTVKASRVEPQPATAAAASSAATAPVSTAPATSLNKAAL